MRRKPEILVTAILVWVAQLAEKETRQTNGEILAVFSNGEP
jgi:hypothetical protein